MGRAVCTDNTCTVDSEQNRQVLQGNVVYQLVVSALQESGVNRHDGLDAFTCQTARKGNGVLLGDSDVEIAVGELLFKLNQAAALAHGRRDGNQTLVRRRLVAQPLAEYLRISRFGRGRFDFRRRHFARQLGDSVVFDRIVFGEFVAVAFFGDDVQQLRAFAAAQVF